MRRSLVIGAGIVALAAVAIAAQVIGSEDRSPLDRAVSAADDRGGYETGLEAGETIARVAQHLEVAVDDCRDDRGGTACQALGSALGWAQVLATWVLDCTDPGRDEARTRLVAYLEEVGAVAPDAGRVPPPPELPICRR